MGKLQTFFYSVCKAIINMQIMEIRLKNVHILLNLIAEYQLSLYVDVSQSVMLVNNNTPSMYSSTI